MMREELWEFGDYGGTGGKFQEETPEKKVFNEAASKKAKDDRVAAEKKDKDRTNVRSNRVALECLVQKMQKKSVNIHFSSDILIGHYRTHDNQSIRQHTDNFSVLSICNQLFLIKLNDKNKIHIIKNPVNQSSDRVSYEACFENENNYNTLDINDENSTNKWAWDILNTAIKHDTFPNLKPFLNYYN